MRSCKLFVLTALILLASVSSVIAAFDPSELNEPANLIAQAITGTDPWTVPLMPVFQSAAKKYNVPLTLLLTLGYYGSTFENRGGAPTIEGGYGVMALRDNTIGGTSLNAGAALISSTAETLKVDPALNIQAAAAVLDSYAKAKSIDRSKGLQAWVGVVTQYAGLDEENATFFAAEVYDKLKAGLNYTNAAGENFQFDTQSIGSVDTAAMMPAPTVGSSEYGPAIWDPAGACNYSAIASTKDTVICHTIEGSAAGARSWFKNCSAQVSAHYVVSEAGGVWQCVDEDYKAWHASCYNSRAIGIEHEGYAASGSHPAALYNASGLLTRHLCDRWGIPKQKRTSGPGVIGHIDVTHCCCGTHTDPGNGWDWNYYIQQVNGGAPPPPTWAASYRGQSYPATMTAGTTAVVWAEYTNTGTGAWHHAETYLGTSSPQDRSSPFFTSGNWAGANRPSEVDQTEVLQNGVGRFTFILTAPSTPGTYVEKYKPVREGVAWFGDEVTWTITVTAANGNITGTVRNSANSAGISGATVAVSGGPATTTNSSGVYTFTGLAPTTYTLTASMYSFNSASGSATVVAGQTATKDFSLTSTDATPPSVPTGLTASGISPSQINLAWSASTDTGGSGLAGYIVYRANVEVGRTTAVTYTDNGLVLNTGYTYTVKAYDNANNVSAASAPASASTKPGTVPIFEDGFAGIDGNLWTALVQSPMPGAYPPVWDNTKNHGTFPGAGSIRTLTSTNANQGCLLGHTFSPGFGAAKFESWFYDSSVNDASRQGLQVRCLDGGGGVKAIYYLGTYSAAPGSQATYSAGYYKVCGSGCTGWYWPGALCKTRVVGWHKFTIDFLPYTGSGDVKYYIDDVLVCTTDRTLDTQTYGLNMVAYGYHYRVNVEGWFDDCAMYSSAPLAPTMLTPTASSSTSINWAMGDNSNNEIGFRILDAAQTVKASAGVSNGTAGTVNLTESGLLPNTPYTRYAKAFNGSLNSLSSAAATRWTLANAPSTSNVTCNRSAGTWYATSEFAFTAVGGFGQGTVSKYAYAWDSSPTHTWTGSEAIWNSGSLILNAGSAGSYYLHVKGFNGEDVASGTLDCGPFRFEPSGPTNPTSATETHGAQDGVWQSTVADPAFTWPAAVDPDSGIAGYLVYFGADEQGTSTDLVTSPAYDPAAVTTGSYFLRLKTRNNAGNEAGEWSTVFNFKYDSSAPTTPVVTDDGQYSGSATKLHATWLATDADSGVAEYQYAVGTTVGGAETLGWTSAAAATDVVMSLPAPGLTAGNRYYISAKAKNGAGAWSDVGSSDGIKLADPVNTIAEAKAKDTGNSVGLVGVIVTASSEGSYYIEEPDRFSGVLVAGALPDGAGNGALVTVGGKIGLSNGERAILEPATVLESAADLGRIPAALFINGRDLGGADFGDTPGGTDRTGLNNIGLLVTVCGWFVPGGEHDFSVGDGSVIGPTKVIAYGMDISGFTSADYVTVTGIASLEQTDTVLTPVIRVLSGGKVTKAN